MMKRGLAGTWNGAAGTLTASLLGGPSITARPLGYWPAPGQAAWFEEVSPGSWICHGPTADAGYRNTWTAGVTNLILGNGTVTAAYARIAKNIDVRIAIAFGTTTSISAALSIAMPTGITSVSTAPQALVAEIFAAGTGAFTGFAAVPSGSTVIQPFSPTSTATSTMGQIGSFSMVYGNTSAIVINGSFECA